jgi:alcohol dehydrogenase class IV
LHTFDFTSPKQILFGAGRVKELPEIALLNGMDRCLVVTGHSPQRVAGVVEHLHESGIEIRLFSVLGEPAVEIVRQGVLYAADGGCNSVVAIGGGSALDAGKAIAALMRNDGDVLDYLEVIGKGKELAQPSAPWIAVPTTAGTGAEVTRNAVLFSSKERVKVSLRSPWMLPVTALVDPELTLDLPRSQTLASGMDALTQLIEPYVCSCANPLTDGFCLQGLPLVARSLRRVCADGHNIEARCDMSLASLLSGLALANAGLGVVHGFAGPLGGMLNAPHGAICAALLPHGMQANLAHLRREQHSTPNSSDIIERYHIVAQLLTGRNNAEPEEGIRFVQDLATELGVLPLSSFGMGPEQVDEVVEKAQRASSMKRNPVKLSVEELRGVYLGAL